MEVLSHPQIENKIKRIAYQIFEAFLDQGELVVAGINGNGFELAKKVNEQLQSISPLKTTLVEIKLDKTKPKAATTSLDVSSEEVHGKPVLIVDDVLNTGRTMVYAVSAFIREECALIKTAVLADRNHKNFPIAADFVGISMATTLQEHLQFSLENGKMSLELQ